MRKCKIKDCSNQTTSPPRDYCLYHTRERRNKKKKLYYDNVKRIWVELK